MVPKGAKSGAGRKYPTPTNLIWGNWDSGTFYQGNQGYTRIPFQQGGMDECISYYSINRNCMTHLNS